MKYLVTGSEKIYYEEKEIEAKSGAEAQEKYQEMISNGEVLVYESDFFECETVPVICKK